jgi:hypothetical protein
MKEDIYALDQLLYRLAQVILNLVSCFVDVFAHRRQNIRTTPDEVEAFAPVYLYTISASFVREPEWPGQASTRKRRLHIP